MNIWLCRERITIGSSFYLGWLAPIKDKKGSVFCMEDWKKKLKEKLEAFFLVGEA